MVNLGMIVGDRLGDILQQHGSYPCAAAQRSARAGPCCGLTRSITRADLSFTVDRSCRATASGSDRAREIVEIDAVTDDIGIVEIDADQLGQRKIALAVARGADFAFDGVASTQAIFADLVR